MDKQNSTSSNACPTIVVPGPALRPAANIQLSHEALAAIINLIPAEQRTELAKLLAPAAPTVPSDTQIADKEAKKKAMLAAEEAVKAAQAKVVEMAARAAAHDQQVAKANAEMAELKIAADVLTKSITKYLAPLAGKDHFFGDDDQVKAAEQYVANLKTLGEINRKREAKANELSQLTMEGNVISSETNAAQDALDKADAGLIEAQSI